MEITPIKKILVRCEELKGNNRFPTQFDAFKSWIDSINEIMENLKDTSLNSKDYRLRAQDLMNRILA